MPDREKLIELIGVALTDVIVYDNCYPWIDDEPQTKIADYLIANGVAVLPVEVVRCEMCSYGRYLNGANKYECHHPLYIERNRHRGEHFCSYGERRTE